MRNEMRIYRASVILSTVLGLLLGLVIYNTPATNSLVACEFVTGGLCFAISLFVTPIILARRA